MANASPGEPSTLRVAFVGSLAASFAERVRAHLTEPCDIVFTDETEVVSRMPEIDVLVSLVLTRAMGAAATRLRLVQVPGAGLDRIDRSALPPAALLANAYGHETGIAEYVLGAMLMLARRFTGVDAALRRGIWESQWAPGVAPPPAWPELAGKTLGILGHGRIGQAVARRARAFDMAIMAIRRDVTRISARTLAPDLDFLGGPGDLGEILRRADYLALTLPLTEDTRGLLGDAALRTMKPTAVLINVSRAGIVDEEALYRALVETRIAGAALDVWYRYPSDTAPCFPAHLPFHELPNVLMTPHVAGWTDGTLEARAKVIAENVHRAARGESPVNRIQ